MADYGLINGFAEAIKQGLATYQDVKKNKEESALKNRMLKLQGFDKGIVEDPETGALDYSAEKKDETDFNQKLKIGELQGKGLLPEYDEASKLKGFIRDPNAPKDAEKALDTFKKTLEINKLQKEMGSPAEKFKQLPEEKKKQIETLSTKTAGKKAINNQIKATLSLLKDPNTSEDQKIVMGRQLLKTLNSAEGADAIGVEEARRLGSLLEFQIGNFTGPGPMFGRDVNAFVDQVANTSKNLEEAIALNESDVDSIYGRESSNKGLLKKENISPIQMSREEKIKLLQGK